MKNTKLVLSILLFLFLLQSISAQDTGAYKYAEYQRPQGASCDEFFRLEDFLEEIVKKDGKGLIIVYSENNEERFGNLLAFKSGVKKFLKDVRGFDTDRISVVISEGKALFNEEFWVIPKGAAPPEIKPPAFDWANLETKYLFGITCVNCSPSYGLLTSTQPGYEEYANVLIKNPGYKGLIIVADYSTLKFIRKTLVKEYKLPQNRFTVQLSKVKDDEPGGEEFYIVPQNNITAKKNK